MQTYLKNLSFYLSLLSILTLTISATSLAVTFSVVGPCSPDSEYKGSFKTDLSENVGKISMDIFDFNQIPYIGTQDGMNSILNTPTGLDSAEIISDTKMRAYGWCYSVNGEIPNVLPSEYFFKSQSDHLVWFYAFSTYDKGAWLDYCVPSYTIKAPQFCQ